MEFNIRSFLRKAQANWRPLNIGSEDGACDTVMLQFGATENDSGARAGYAGGKAAGF